MSDKLSIIRNCAHCLAPNLHFITQSTEPRLVIRCSHCMTEHSIAIPKPYNNIPIANYEEHVFGMIDTYPHSDVCECFICRWSKTQWAQALTMNQNHLVRLYQARQETQNPHEDPPAWKSQQAKTQPRSQNRRQQQPRLGYTTSQADRQTTEHASTAHPQSSSPSRANPDFGIYRGPTIAEDHGVELSAQQTHPTYPPGDTDTNESPDTSHDATTQQHSAHHHKHTGDTPPAHAQTAQDTREATADADADSEILAWDNPNNPNYASYTQFATKKCHNPNIPANPKLMSTYINWAQPFIDRATIIDERIINKYIKTDLEAIKQVVLMLNRQFLPANHEKNSARETFNEKIWIQIYQILEGHTITKELILPKSIEFNTQSLGWVSDFPCPQGFYYIPVEATETKSKQPNQPTLTIKSLYPKKPTHYCSRYTAYKAEHQLPGFTYNGTNSTYGQLYLSHP